jgi:two-component system nitrate/nitrite response regulator NarL
MTRVLLADGHRLFADLLGGFLTAHGVDVVGVATTAVEAEARARADRPELCLVDAATVGPADPAALLGRLVATGVRVVVLTGTGDDPGPARDAGAAGYLRKTVSGADLLAALDRVAHGEVVVMAAGAAPAGADDADEADARRRLAGLRARERECLELIAGGASTEDMAVVMGVTPATVRSHVRAVLAALDVHSRLGAASFALRHGVVGTSVPHEAAHRAG